MSKKIIIWIVVILLIVTGGLVVWKLPVKQNVKITPDNNNTNVWVTLSSDGKFSGFTEIIESDKVCNFHILNKETQENKIIKTISCTDQQVADNQCDLCAFTSFKTFSPNDDYVLMDSGTGTTRNFEIINTKTGKSIANFASFSIYYWLNNDEFIFNDPQPQNEYRPWGDGDGMGISKINLLTGKKTILKQADSTHDYGFEGNSNESAITGNQIFIDIRTYPSDGFDRFEKGKYSYWNMSTIDGKLINNLDGYENYGH